MLNDKSTFTREFGYLIDRFDELQDLRHSELDNLDEYRRLKMLKNDGLPVDENRLNILESIYRTKIITSARWNKFQNALVGMQTFIKDEVEGFVLDKQAEIQNEQVQALGSIQTAKDGALISIENKKDNIIDYMDSTTAGALRNDIGVMAELTTTNKDNLVEAVNEVNAKGVDLTPVNNRISSLESVVGELDNAVTVHLDDEATGVHKAKNIALEDSEGIFISTELEGAMNELFTNVSDGKLLVGGAITDVDGSVVIPTDPTFSDLAIAIGQISSGKKWASGVTRSISTPNAIEVSGLDFTPSFIIAKEDISSSNYQGYAVYADMISIGAPTSNLVVFAASVNTSGFATIREGYFKLGVSSTGRDFRWIAFE